MIDLNAIKHRHLDPERMKGRTYYAGHIELDLAVLVAEVERLQSYASDCEQHAKFATEKATALERAAVVAWMREHWSEVLEQTPQQTARLIERGEHRREVTK